MKIHNRSENYHGKCDLKALFIYLCLLFTFSIPITVLDTEDTEVTKRQILALMEPYFQGRKNITIRIRIVI